MWEPTRDLADLIQHSWQTAAATPLAVDDPANISTYDYTNDPLARRTNVAFSGQAFGLPTSAIGHPFGYNDRNELTGSARTDGVMYALSYTYDPIGNRSASSAQDPPIPSTYFSNALNQYHRVELQTGSTTFAQGYHYDNDGNLSQAHVAADMNCDGAINTFDIDPFVLALTDPETYAESYPACNPLNGDLNGDGALNTLDLDLFTAFLTGHSGAGVMRYDCRWDAENRLVYIGPNPLATPADWDIKEEFAYDYLGRLVLAKVSYWDPEQTPAAWSVPSETAFVWSGWLMLMELQNVGTPSQADFQPVRKYTWGLDLAGQNGQVNSLEGAGGIGGLLGVEQAQLAESWNHGAVAAGNYTYTYDGNGNVGQVLKWDALSLSTAMKARYQYDPYGNLVSRLGTYADANPFRFSTKYWEDWFGLGYWGYRWYSPVIGRWISRDPLEEADSVALYAFEQNAPSFLVDGLGLEAKDHGTCSDCAKTCARDEAKAQSALGITVCEKGKPCHCVCASRVRDPVEQNSPGLKAANDAIEKCVADHEGAHVNQYKCCGDSLCGEGDTSECDAQSTHAECLRISVDACKVGALSPRERCQCLRRLSYILRTKTNCLPPDKGTCSQASTDDCNKKLNEATNVINKALQDSNCWAKDK